MKSRENISGVPPVDASALEALRPSIEVFEELGLRDPMYAALTKKRYEGNRWNPAEFFQTGKDEVLGILEYVQEKQWPLGRKSALDFGCGIGRLTQALGEHFEIAIGVDVAASMVEHARAHNRLGGRVQFLVNQSTDLRLLETGTFDLVYTNKVLQHIRPELQAVYIQEFVRVLQPGGLAIFQLRNGPRIRPGSLRAMIYTFNRIYFRRFARKLRGRPGYEMHFLARSTVHELVEQAGGVVIDVVDLSSGKSGLSLRFCVTRS
jgi:SAM-dependent methyltransferase